MNELISIRKSSSGVMVNVTQKDGDNTVHWQERVTEGALILPKQAGQIPGAIKLCRNRCAQLWAGIAQAQEVES